MILSILQEASQKLAFIINKGHANGILLSTVSYKGGKKGLMMK